MKLYAPDNYFTLSESEKKEICNGCGARDGIDVPDTIVFIDISEACQIHDYMYKMGTTNDDKALADKTFFLNMLSIIEDGWKWLGRHRTAVAYGYYVAVRDFGNKAFWEGKR